MNRQETESFIHENFAGITQDYPWDDTPEYTVFRHGDNRKWFALILPLNPNLLKNFPVTPDTPQKIDIINLKSDPDLIETLLDQPGIYPAYHMNKRYWISVVLDGALPRDRLASLIDLSYQLTSKKRRPSPMPML